MRQSVNEVYQWVVDDVVQKVEGVFAQEGIDPSVLCELRSSWSRKLKESGAMGVPPDELDTDGHDSGRPRITSSRTPYGPPMVQSLHATHRPLDNSDGSHATFGGLAQKYMFGMPDARSVPHDGRRGAYPSSAYVTPGQYMHWPTAVYPPLRQTAFLAGMPAMRHQIIAPDGATTAAGARQNTNRNTFGDQTMANSVFGGNTQNPADHVELRIFSQQAKTRPQSSTVRSIRIAPEQHIQFPVPPPAAASKPSQVARVSGKRKEYEDAESVHEPSPSIKTARLSNDTKATRIIPQRDGGNDEDSTGLNQKATSSQEKELDDDGTLSDVDDEEEPIESTNCLAAQYDKVSRIKSRWRCLLKNGIFNVDGREYLFKSANGEFMF